MDTYDENDDTVGVDFSDEEKKSDVLNNQNKDSGFTMASKMINQDKKVTFDLKVDAQDDQDDFKVPDKKVATEDIVNPKFEILNLDNIPISKFDDIDEEGDLVFDDL